MTAERPQGRRRLAVAGVAAAAFAIASVLATSGGSDPEVPDTTTTTAPTPSGAAGEPTRSSTLAPEDIVPTGRFVGAPGTGAVAGSSGRLRTYSVEVEEGVPVDPFDFVLAVERILGDPRGWTRDGTVSLQRVEASASPSFRVRLATPRTTDVLCAPLDTGGTQSCRQGVNVVINHLRWERGAAPSRLSLTDYRTYLISHEVGHALGHGHLGCPGPGLPAPVMMQQTITIGACAPNPWPFPGG